MDEVAEKIRVYLLDKVLGGDHDSRLTLTTPLTTSGLLSSISRLELVAFLERTFGIELASHEVDEENFETVAAIATLVQSKRTTG